MVTNTPAIPVVSEDVWAPPHIEWRDPQPIVEIPIYPLQLPEVTLPQVQLPPLPEVPLPEVQIPPLPDQFTIDLLPLIGR